MPVYSLDGMVPALPESGSYWIAPDAHVIGDVAIGADVGIWFGAVLRGDTELIRVGVATNIQEGSLLHTDMGYPISIGSGCTIGHHAILHGCEIADDCLIGMGATILNGAKIGAGSLVGAGALVTERKEFPERSLIIGSPAKLVRTLTDEDVEKIRNSARHYVENWRRIATGLKRIDG